MSALFFAKRVSRQLLVQSELTENGKHRSYRIYGQVFFASADQFTASFNFKEALEKVTIDMTQAHFWDLTGVNALDKVVLKFRREGSLVAVIGLNEASATTIEKLGTQVQGV